MTNSTPHPRSWEILVQLLREIAEEKQITQEHIAKETGMHFSNVSRFFALKYCPRLDTFLAVAKAIGINFFFEDRDNQTDLNKLMELAMQHLGRRPGNSQKN